MKPWYEGKIILITGATDGVGRELAKRLHEKAKALILVGRSDEKFDTLAAELKFSKYVMISCDVADEDTVETLFTEGIRLGSVDAFVSCAGGTRVGTFESLKSEEIRETIDTHLLAPILWLKRLLPPMMPGSRVVFMSSRSAERALSRLSIYTAVKAAVEKLADALRNEYAARGIGFTVISPGSINTAFTRHWLDADRDAHNAESMSVANAVEPIVMALSVPFAVNKVSYESFEQWKNEPGVME